MSINTGGAVVPILGFGVFAVATDEFVLAGMLPRLAEAHGVSVPTAGQVVTAFALSCALSGPLLTTLTSTWSRRTALLAATGLYLLGAVATALAGSFPVLLAAQVVTAAGTGLFVPVAAATAAALVPPERRGRAIGTVLTGFTAATAFGAPIGTALGGQFGWRATMWFVVALAVVGTAGLVARVPRGVAAPPAAGVRQRLAPLADARVLVTLATTMAAFTAVYVLYTYSAEVFAPATGPGGERLAALLGVFGVVAVFGNYAAGALVDRVGGRAVMTGCLVWVALGLAALPLVTGSFAASIGFVAVFAVAAFSMSTPQQHRLIGLDPPSAPVLVSLHASVLYLAIALSGVVGGLGILWLGAGRLGLLASGIAVLGIALSELAHRLTGRRVATGGGR